MKMKRRRQAEKVAEGENPSKRAEPEGAVDTSAWSEVKVEVASGAPETPARLPSPTAEEIAEMAEEAEAPQLCIDHTLANYAAWCGRWLEFLRSNAGRLQVDQISEALQAYNVMRDQCMRLSKHMRLALTQAKKLDQLVREFEEALGQFTE